MSNSDSNSQDLTSTLPNIFKFSKSVPTDDLWIIDKEKNLHFQSENILHISDFSQWNRQRCVCRFHSGVHGDLLKWCRHFQICEIASNSKFQAIGYRIDHWNPKCHHPMKFRNFWQGLMMESSKWLRYALLFHIPKLPIQ